MFFFNNFQPSATADTVFRSNTTHTCGSCSQPQTVPLAFISNLVTSNLFRSVTPAKTSGLHLQLPFSIGAEEGGRKCEGNEAEGDNGWHDMTV